MMLQMHQMLKVQDPNRPRRQLMTAVIPAQVLQLVKVHLPHGICMT